MSTSVLLASDDLLLFEILQNKLLENNFLVFYAKNISELNSIVSKNNIDVILLDIRKNIIINNVNFSIIRELKRIAQVILINNPENVSASIRCMIEGAIDQIDVPFDIQTFFNKINEAIKTRKKFKKIMKNTKTFDVLLQKKSSSENLTNDKT